MTPMEEIKADRIQELEAQLDASQTNEAVLREALKRATSDLVVVRGAIIAMHDDYWTMGGPLWARIHDAADRYGAALASPSPGDKIMAVVEAAKHWKMWKSEFDEFDGDRRRTRELFADAEDRLVSAIDALGEG